MKILYDIESNGLNPDTIWMIVAYNLDTDTIYKFTNNGTGHGTIQDGVNLLSNAELLVGHNILGFDSRIIDKLFNTKLINKPSHDTLLMSKVLNFSRNREKHGLGVWGETLGYPKIDFDKEKFMLGDDPEVFKEMMTYCIQDVKLNVKVYRILLEELNKISLKYPLIKKGLQIEHDVAKFNAIARTQGWNFDLERARETQRRMLERMNEIEGVIEPMIGERIVYIDKEPKTPKYKKNGDYNSHTCRWLSEYFGHPVEPGDTHLMEPGTEFQRSEQVQVRLGQLEVVKDWLQDQGWKPDEYQRKMVDGRWITTDSAKLEGPRLLSFKLNNIPVGKLISEYTTIRNRQSVISGWISNLQNDRLHGDMNICGTPTFRCKHSVIVNLPKPDVPWGKELREVFKADDGMVLVGCDSAGNQLRGLCHYVRNDAFTNEVINGDQHQRNADVLGCSRTIAKEYLYAYLFGAGDSKLGRVLTGKNNPTVGRQSKERFAKSIKGLQELRNKLSNVWKNTRQANGKGYFPALDGRPIFSESEHRTLNYLLQSAEAITCKAAISYQMQKIREAGIEAQPRIFYHDESAWQCKPEDARIVGEILRDSFKEAPKWFNVECMAGGEYIIGDNYSDVH